MFTKSIGKTNVFNNIYILWHFCCITAKMSVAFSRELRGKFKTGIAKLYNNQLCMWYNFNNSENHKNSRFLQNTKTPPNVYLLMIIRCLFFYHILSPSLQQNKESLCPKERSAMAIKTAIFSWRLHNAPRATHMCYIRIPKCIFILSKKSNLSKWDGISWSNKKKCVLWSFLRFHWVFWNSFHNLLGLSIKNV